MIQRRMFLKSGGLTLFATASGAMPAFVNLAARAAASGKPKVLVTVFQRFGMDGLMAVAPYGDAYLAKLRPNLMLSRPGSGKDDARIDLDGQYGLHPSLSALAPLFREGSLAIVHASGSPDNTRSHSDAQQWWESGTPGDRSVADGWLNRAVAATSEQRAALRAVSMTSDRPRIFYGDQAITSIADIDALSLSFPESMDGPAALAHLQTLYRKSGNELLRHAGTDGFEAARIIAEARRASAGAQAAGYPVGSSFGTSLREIAQLIKADVGLQVAFAESRTNPDGKGTWDTHSNEASLSGPFPLMGRDFSQSLAAFWNDLGERREDVVLVTLTDFGRNVVENKTVGSDHGRATAMFVLGGSVRGGRVYGTLPERFVQDALEDQMDLPVTTDFRSVLAALTRSQLGISQDERVFPGWRGERMGLMKA